MKTQFTAIALFLSLGTAGFAHRLDEYLQATLLSVEKDRIQATMRLIPGVAVYPIVLAAIDSNRDGVLSDTEQQAYAQHVLQDLRLTLDGQPLKPALISSNFPSPADMKEGLGEIQIAFTAALPAGASHRKLVLENHHQSRISAYLVNSLVPADKNIQITAQNRNYNQSFYQLDYALSAGVSPADFGNFPSLFRLGMRHIAEGTDHLLFLLTLLLPAPLLVLNNRWAGFGGARHSLLRILRVVTAFTIGHSLTLALAAIGLVRAPSRPIEALIAVSIFISAIHALRPIFAGREAAIAAFFGLIHGLAFAATLGNLGLGWWQRAAGILGFNLGIETMQLIVICAAMPSLLLLSRTRAYSVLRIGGALFAGLASAGWIAERVFNIHTSADLIVDACARHAVSLAAGLFLISLICWLAASQKIKPAENATKRILPIETII